MFGAMTNQSGFLSTPLKYPSRKPSCHGYTSCRLFYPLRIPLLSDKLLHNRHKKYNATYWSRKQLRIFLHDINVLLLVCVLQIPLWLLQQDKLQRTIHKLYNVQHHFHHVLKHVVHDKFRWTHVFVQDILWLPIFWKSVLGVKLVSLSIDCSLRLCHTRMFLSGIQINHWRILPTEILPKVPPSREWQRRFKFCATAHARITDQKQKTRTLRAESS